MKSHFKQKHIYYTLIIGAVTFKLGPALPVLALPALSMGDRKTDVQLFVVFSLVALVDWRTNESWAGGGIVGITVW